jgi:hypothetical protein
MSLKGSNISLSPQDSLNVINVGGIGMKRNSLGDLVN